MLIPKLAIRNLLGAGLRTWLNAIALSFTYVVIIAVQGLYAGMNRQAEQASIAALYGGGQYWQASYDPYNPLTLPDAHTELPPQLQALVRSELATPILVRDATMYPQGRFRGVLLKGIDHGQTLLDIPTRALDAAGSAIPGIIGTRMARSALLKPGDQITVRWRDVHGTFDAGDVVIVRVMSTIVPEIDNGQIWIPLDRLRRMTDMPNQATLVVVKPGVSASSIAGWQFKDLSFLLRDLHTLILRDKTFGASILYTLLLFLAMLAIFDTQVLSIFRRRREIGTMMALGMTRPRVIALFTTEGALHAVLAALLAMAYGLPLMVWMAKTGYPVPAGTDTFGIALGERIFPAFSALLVVGTTLLVLVVTTIVSFIPARRIAKLKPTDALRGRASWSASS